MVKKNEMAAINAFLSRHRRYQIMLNAFKVNKEKSKWAFSSLIISKPAGIKPGTAQISLSWSHLTLWEFLSSECKTLYRSVKDFAAVSLGREDSKEQAQHWCGAMHTGIWPTSICFLGMLPIHPWASFTLSTLLLWLWRKISCSVIHSGNTMLLSRFSSAWL